VYSLKRRFAKVVRSYQRLNDLYAKSRAREEALKEKVRELRAENRDLKHELKERERSATSLDALLAVVRYASAQAAIAGDDATSEKLAEWYEVMSGNLKPPPPHAVHRITALLKAWLDYLDLADRAPRDLVDDRRDHLRRETMHVLDQLQAQTAGLFAGADGVALS